MTLISRPAKCEKPEHTGVCEDFEHEHNAEITIFLSYID